MTDTVREGRPTITKTVGEGGKRAARDVISCSDWPAVLPLERLSWARRRDGPAVTVTVWGTAEANKFEIRVVHEYGRVISETVESVAGGNVSTQHWGLIERLVDEARFQPAPSVNGG